MDGPHEEPITLEESDLDIDKGTSNHMLRPKQQVDLLGFSVNLAISTLGGGAFWIYFQCRQRSINIFVLGLLSLPFVFNVTGYIVSVFIFI